ncbi:tRNA (adenine(58)-N(1))-methyltransferase catalytic subunit TRM61 [Cucumispora dikerogammari]|nr:tRNA (adenine(58)-N(1))-methyltransferase catalytic subunit TRM61 [Cucumispora dikerogammari]
MTPGITKKGEKIVVRLSNTDYRQITLEEKGVLNTEFGQLPHSTFINKKINSPVTVFKKYKDRIIETKYFILRPSFSHLFKTTERQTQILFMPDIAMIMHDLDIIGRIVLEAGTGSATLTRGLASLAQTVHTFEINQARYLKNKEILKEYSNVQIYNSDVYETNLNQKEFEGIDRVFVDIPNPEILCEKLILMLKKGDKICIFVPSIEQIQRVHSVYKVNFGLRVFENISREILSKIYNEGDKTKKGIGYKNEDYLHTGYLIFGIKF